MQTWFKQNVFALAAALISVGAMITTLHNVEREVEEIRSDIEAHEGLPWHPQTGQRISVLERDYAKVEGSLADAVQALNRVDLNLVALCQATPNAKCVYPSRN